MTVNKNALLTQAVADLQGCFGNVWDKKDLLIYTDGNADIADTMDKIILQNGGYEADEWCIYRALNKHIDELTGRTTIQAIGLDQCWGGNEWQVMVTFTQDIHDLPAGKAIYLQLPECLDSMYDMKYSDEANNEAIRIFKRYYSDTEICYMGIANNINLECLKCRKFYNIEINDWVYILHDKQLNRYLEIVKSNYSSCNNTIVWELADHISYICERHLYKQKELKAMFENGLPA